MDLNNAIKKIDNLNPSWLGKLIFNYLPYRRKIVMSNIDKVFADNLTLKQKNNLAQAFYAHLLKSIKEMILLRFMSEKKLRTLVEVRGANKLMDIANKGKGVLILTGHFGNWEFAPLGGILNFEQFKGQFHFIRRTLGNKTIEKILFKRYFKAGLNVIPKKNSLNQVCDVIEKGHAVIFVLDQHASLVNRDGIAADFFGKKAGTYRSLATIARYTNIPVVPAAGFRLESGRHVLEFGDPIEWKDYENTKESIYRNTLEYNKALERIILENPEQWLWLHKRWKI